MKFLWKMFVGFHVLLYRLTRGRVGSEMRGFKVLILNTIGRKSGKIHSNTVGYLIVASNTGLPTRPAWYHDLKANSNFTIQVKDKVMSVDAKIISGSERTSLWKWVIEAALAFADYEKQIAREIPLVLFQPQ